MDSDTPDVPGEQLALAGVQPAANREAELVDALDELVRAADRARRPVERCDKAITDGLDFPASEAAELVAHEGVVAVEQLSPGAVSEPGGVPGRLDDVGEEDRRQHALRAAFGAAPGQKLFDQVGLWVVRSGEVVEVGPGRLDEPRPRDQRRRLAPRRDTGISGLSRRCTTSLGTRIAGSTPLRSERALSSRVLRAMDGLIDERSNRVHQSTNRWSPARLGANSSMKKRLSLNPRKRRTTGMKEGNGRVLHRRPSESRWPRPCVGDPRGRSEALDTGCAQAGYAASK